MRYFLSKFLRFNKKLSLWKNILTEILVYLIEFSQYNCKPWKVGQLWNTIVGAVRCTWGAREVQCSVVQFSWIQWSKVHTFKVQGSLLQCSRIQLGALQYMHFVAGVLHRLYLQYITTMMNSKTVNTIKVSLGFYAVLHSRPSKLVIKNNLLLNCDFVICYDIQLFESIR